MPCVPPDYRAFLFPFDKSSITPKVPGCSQYVSHGVRVSRNHVCTVGETDFTPAMIDNIKKGLKKPNYGYLFVLMPCSLNGYALFSYYRELGTGGDSTMKVNLLSGQMDNSVLNSVDVNILNNVGNNGCSTFFNISSTLSASSLSLSEVKRAYSHWRVVSGGLSLTSSSGSSLDSGVWECMNYDSPGGYLFPSLVRSNGTSLQANHYLPDPDSLAMVCGFSSWNNFSGYATGPVSGLSGTVFSLDRKLYPDYQPNEFFFSKYAFSFVYPFTVASKYVSVYRFSADSVNGLDVDVDNGLSVTLLDRSYLFKYVVVRNPACGSSFSLDLVTNYEAIPNTSYRNLLSTALEGSRQQGNSLSLCVDGSSVPGSYDVCGLLSKYGSLLGGVVGPYPFSSGVKASASCDYSFGGGCNCREGCGFGGGLSGGVGGYSGFGGGYPAPAGAGGGGRRRSDGPVMYYEEEEVYEDEGGLEDEGTDPAYGYYW